MILLVISLGRKLSDNGTFRPKCVTYELGAFAVTCIKSVEQGCAVEVGIFGTGLIGELELLFVIQ